MRGYIFANGAYAEPAWLLDPAPEDLVVAADGGSKHCQELGLLPDVLIGDLDSTDPELVTAWDAAGVEVIRYPEDKDQTDLELALLLAQQRGADQLLVFGAVGGRLDMTFSNLTLLAHPDLKVPVTLVSGQQETHLLRPGDHLTLKGRPGDTLSLIPLQPGDSRVTASGVSYALDREDLHFGTTRGISNQLVENQAEVQLHTGLLAVVHIRAQSPKEGS